MNVQILKNRVNFMHKDTEIVAYFDRYENLDELKEILADELSEKTNDIIESEIMEADSIEAIKTIAENRGHKISLI